jgi:hypothetical protein
LDSKKESSIKELVLEASLEVKEIVEILSELETA